MALPVNRPARASATVRAVRAMRLAGSRNAIRSLFLRAPRPPLEAGRHDRVAVVVERRQFVERVNNGGGEHVGVVGERAGMYFDGRSRHRNLLW